MVTNRRVKARVEGPYRLKEVIAVVHRTSGIALCLLLAAAATQAAPLVAPLGGGLHGIALKPAADSTAAYAVVVAATSLDPQAVAAPELPGDFVQRVGDTEQGVYVREEWDKGALLRDNFSARWTGTLKVDKDAEHTFYLTTDDGTRMWVDGNLLIDAWVPRPPTTSEEKLTLGAGAHEVRVEYYEQGGAATARLEWSAEGLERQAIPADHVTHNGQAGWQVEYYKNADLKGEPLGTLTDGTIDHAWGEGGPQIGKEEPGEVVLEWTRVADNAIVGRVHSGPESKIVLLNMPVGQGQAGQPDFKGEVLGAGEEVHFTREGVNARVWVSPTEDSYVFVAGFEPLPDISETEARAKLKAAYLASLKPKLPTGSPDEGGWISVLNGTDFAGWKPRWGETTGNWTVKDGALQTTGGNTDLVSEWTFLDYDLHIEFSYPKGSNSGVYFQGRYEIQVLDSFGGPVESHQCGALYGIQAPKENVTKPAGEWQSFDVSFKSATLDDNGRVVPARISITHNGVLTIKDAAIPHATGGEMDRNYLQPGPIMLQGTHGTVSYRNIRVKVMGDR
ncbi:MAG: DUF1080 domain-containing protein [Armatimonadetes bacterium]|nr:DUF1080 domain-containing protein [Armatimonadota bacterium]